MPDLIAAQFLVAPNGTEDFGFIDVAAAAVINAPPGPIRLQHGYPGPKGYGNRHVEAYADRMEHLRGIGFGTFAAFAYDVGQNYQTIRQANAPRFFVVYRKLTDNGIFDLKLVVEPQTANRVTVWNTISGIFAPRDRSPILYTVTRTGGCVPQPIDTERPRFETLSLPKKPLTGDRGS